MRRDACAAAAEKSKPKKGLVKEAALMKGTAPTV